MPLWDNSKVKKSIFIFILILSHSVLRALPIESIEDIYNIDLNKFCEEKLQFNKIEKNGVVERGCLNVDGELNGLWVRQFKERSLTIRTYQNGDIGKYIFDAHPKAQDVSIINLIATPDKYVGKHVRITGYYFNPHFEITGISMNHVDHKFSGSKNAIWVKLPKYLLTEAVKEKVNNKYVLLEGVFTKFKGHMGQYSGTIEQVNRIEPRDTLNKVLEKSYTK